MHGMTKIQQGIRRISAIMDALLPYLLSELEAASARQARPASVIRLEGDSSQRSMLSTSCAWPSARHIAAMHISVCGAAKSGLRRKIELPDAVRCIRNITGL